MYYKEKAQYCPGEVCDVKSKQAIQKTSGSQLLIILGFTALIFLAIYLLNDSFSKKPTALFGTERGVRQNSLFSELGNFLIICY
jgi:hypothetical protein